MSRVSKHRHHRLRSFLRNDFDLGMAFGEHPENFVRESLSDGFDLSKVEPDFTEPLEVHEESLRLGTRNVVAPQQPNEYPRLLKLKAILLRRELRERFFQTAPARAFNLELHIGTFDITKLGDEDIVAPIVPLELNTMRSEQEAVSRSRGEENAFTRMLTRRRRRFAFEELEKGR